MSSDNARPGGSPARRPIGLAFLALLIGVGLIALLMFGLGALNRRDTLRATGPIPLHTPSPGPATAPASPTAAEAASTRAPASRPTETTGVSTQSGALAAVNDQVITTETARAVVAADRAINRLLGQTAASEDDLLDRLVNTELARQAALAAGFTLGEAEAAQALADFLAGHGKSQTDLDAALAAEGLSPADFQDYFSRLILADRFTQAQAQAQGITVAEYLKRLQRAARIRIESASPATGATLTMPASPAQVTAVPTPVAALPTTAATAISRGVQIGQLAPEFTLPGLDGGADQTVGLADLAGRPAVLSFWTTWCPHCQRQTPVLVEAAARPQTRAVRFLGINVKEERLPVQDYVRANGIRYPIGLDTGGQVAEAYQITGFPTTYFLDAAGRIVAQHVGQLTTEQLDAYLAVLLASGG